MKIDGAQLKRLRERRAMSLRELSELAGVDYTAISLMERGQRNPHPRTVRKLTDALGIEAAELVKHDDQAATKSPIECAR